MTATDSSVTFISGPGLRLHGVLYLPDDGAVRPVDGWPAVVLCLGYRPVFGMFAPRYATHLAAAGYAVLTFEYRGFGQSEGPRWRHIAHEQLEDVRNAVTFLANRSDVDASRLAVWGDASFGGAHAVMAGATDKRVRCVVGTTPFADGERLLRETRAPWEWDEFMQQVEADRRARVAGEEPPPVRPEQIIHFEPASHIRAANHAKTHPDLAALQYPLSETADAIISYKPVEHAHKIAPRAVLLIAAEHDLTVPADHARALYDAAREPKKLVVLAGAGHSEVHGSRLDEVLAIGIAFFEQHLGAERHNEVLIAPTDPVSPRNRE